MGSNTRTKEKRLSLWHYWKSEVVYDIIVPQVCCIVSDAQRYSYSHIGTPLPPNCSHCPIRNSLSSGPAIERIHLPLGP
jgi:hypothetical protein